MMQAARELRKFVAPEFIFGVGARRLAGRYAHNLGATRVLLVTDPGVMAAGWARDVEESLAEAQIQVVTYAAVSPNPRAEEVMAGVDVYRDDHCNGIVVVGGGSPMDCAKAIGIAFANGAHILTFEGIDNVLRPIPPLICVPTTAGTASDLSPVSIITDLARKRKIAIVSKAIVPDVALIDPLTATTQSASLSANTAIDALVHGIEAYVSNAQSALTDMLALEGIRHLSSFMLPAIEAPDNVTYRSKTMLGCLETGLAFSNANLGIVHAMAHSVGGLTDRPHGECNAVLLNAAIAFNFPAAGDRYRAVGEAMGLALRDLGLDEVEAVLLAEISRLRKALLLDKTLTEMGVVTSDLSSLAEEAMKDPNMLTNPRWPTLAEVEGIYAAAQ